MAKTQDIDALRSAGVTEADIEWIHDNELPDSRLVVATTASGSDAWWSVRANGTAVLRTNGGRGQAETESAVLHYADLTMNLLCVGEIAATGYKYATGGHAGAGTWFGIAMCTTVGFGSKVMFAASTYGAGPGMELACLVADIYFTAFSHFLLEEE